MDLRKQSHVLFGDILMLSHFLEKQLFTVDENVGVEQIKNLDINGFIFNGMLIWLCTVLDPLNHDGNENWDFLIFELDIGISFVSVRLREEQIK
jgi:hypothetical protein